MRVKTDESEYKVVTFIEEKEIGLYEIYKHIIFVYFYLFFDLFFSAGSNFNW